MRIITGSARGARLKAPRGMETRPTADRVKESVFNILGTRVREARVLDLFAGTGNLGLEALSRGAKSAVFVDNGSSSVAVIRDNACHTKLQDRTVIYRKDVYKAIEAAIHNRQIFDMIFSDPPYNKGLAVATIDKLDAAGILAPDGIIVIEHSCHEALDAKWSCLRKIRNEKYGETMVSFFTNQEIQQSVNEPGGIHETDSHMSGQL
ncbi:16S rRNA (guanine(966)-N(2))-methyltransferase RsmD [Propionispora vibrioides]|uniref:16S rRNA (Guanine(966)-N(2))-methyltransferase RsmD n=1 Tax=Propionispora vibrioides TaxID=112903 RepID=A0A1H8QU18_9FIRM|nr:16S rRNA (guanine(966)-N(2))-methyltransferase RsmD [Propionispora vibrioides]SEO57418.1 16S rRNA (guanine(966)-N(2))-methyltransferase RsmD [Propionispora vibrioides]